MTDIPASTRSIYICDELWERLGPLADQITNGSKSQLIENIIKASLPKIERCVEQSEDMGILICQTCTTR